ncbi:DUF3576 domain-containing protein [uncultured Roseobacter sp.]|uniref:DUF3576 domain-containing protein n=1 Tax=uncultured Roseobacter sp. TaxID=114847 RepID=UPI00263595FC|nr:DUF3576 domain-containing protein [uncultured Roseobacter sp.]
MITNTSGKRIAAAFLCLTLAGCGGSATQSSSVTPGGAAADTSARERNESTGTTIWEAFLNAGAVETRTNVNKYLWSASLEVLEFLPVQSVDPFTGVIVTGFGTPPGGSRAYRATVLIDDPALEARSLNLSLQTRNGPASASTIRAVEDAILTRARQIRNAEGNL